MPRSLGAIVVLALVAAPIYGFSRAGADQQTPTFRATTEFVLIDALVVAKDGTPLEGLRADQFEVFIDGRRRPVASAEFVRASRERLTSPGAAATDAGDVNGRLIVLAIDQSSFPPSAQAAAREAATRVIDRVAAEDYVGLIAFPSAIEVSPARDRNLLRDALTRVGGVRTETLTSRFSLSAAEAVALSSRDPISTGEIIARECERDFRNPTCKQEVIQDGINIATLLQSQAVTSIAGLHGVIDAMATLPGRKTLLVVSAGLPTSTRPGSKTNLAAETDAIARRVAAANVNLYVLYMNVHFLRYFSAEYGRKNHTIFEDIGLFSYGLERFADTGGGSFFQVEVDSDPFVDRALRETSAAYLLAVRPDDAERDGKAHTIRVAVQQRGATIRHRKVVTIPTAR